MRARSGTTVIINSGENSSNSASSSTATSLGSRFGALMARLAIRRAVIVALVLLAGLIPCLALALAHGEHSVLDSSASDIRHDVATQEHTPTSLVHELIDTSSITSTRVQEEPSLTFFNHTRAGFKPESSDAISSIRPFPKLPSNFSKARPTPESRESGKSDNSPHDATFESIQKSFSKAPPFPELPLNFSKARPFPETRESGNLDNSPRQGQFPGNSRLSAAESLFDTSRRILKGCPSLDALADGAREEGELRASDFGGDFVFGFATSAAQVEGAVSEGGRGRSIWDDFAEREGKIKDASNPSVTADQFHRFKDDVALLKAMGATSYRFSISWSRIIPDGMGAVSEAGVQHYSRLIGELLANGIAPAVTLYHWDLPSHLHEAHGGWLNASIVHAFVRYADVCFARFGDRVKTWITFNEPQQTAVQGYGYGTMAPGRCSNRSSCEQGDSSTEPYIVSHHIMLAHAAAVAVYRRRYSSQLGGGGRIGMTMDCIFLYPADGSQESVDAAQQGMEFAFAWFADPLFRGDYPPSMRQAVGSRLPSFSAAESSLLIGSSDFIGLNFYTAQYAAQKTVRAGGEVADVADGVAPWMDCQVDMTAVSPVTGKLIGERTASSWLHVVPAAIQHILTWISHRYPSVPIIITENGMSESNLPSRSLARTLCDDQRVRFYRSYLSSVLQAKWQGVPVEGYYAWSLLDNWEWAMGFSERFGAVFVNFTDPSLPRFPKASALWFKHLLRAHSMHIRGHAVQ